MRKNSLSMNISILFQRAIKNLILKDESFLKKFKNDSEKKRF